MHISPDIENKILKEFLWDSEALKFLRTNTQRYKKISKYDGKKTYNFYYYSPSNPYKGWIDSSIINSNTVNFNIKKLIICQFRVISDIDIIDKIYPGIETLTIYNDNKNPIDIEDFKKSKYILFIDKGLFPKLKNLTIYEDYYVQINYLPENLEYFSM